jgi:DtxR family Mn-dependent transcriptional regulator
MLDSGLTASLEDYLEAILRLERERGLARGKDLARRLGVTNASVSSVVPKLEKMGLVVYERYGPIHLTPKGKRVARGVLRREEVLVAFFREVLGIPHAKARREACRIEHGLSLDSLRRLEAFLSYLRKDPSALKGWTDRPGEGT